MPRPAMRTFLFSDLRDYTVFIETRGDTAATKMLRASRRIVRQAVAKHRGAEVKTEGDSFYVVFRAPSSAVRSAIDIQRALVRHNERHPDLPIHMGIGINTGEAMPHEKGYVGSAVIIASRLKDNARGGQILVTDTVRSLVRTGAHAPMQDLGTWSLKGLSETIRIYEVDPFPSTAARSLGPSLPLPTMLRSSPVVATGLVTCPELVEREAAMASLLEHLAGAARGECHIVALSGEAGVGKSRICRELALRAHRDGFFVLGGRSHAARPLPYEPFVAALRPYARARGPELLRRLLGPLIVELRRLLPELEVTAVPVADDAPEEERRERFLRGVQLLIEDAASQRPLLLVLEDLQEADTSTLDMLRYLAGSLRSGLCLMFTYREEEVARRRALRAVLAELERDRGVARLRLTPLDLDGVRRMTELLLPQRGTDDLVRAVFERSQGVPFYVEELLKTAVDDASGALDLALPSSVRDSVHLRIGRLVAEHGPQSGDLLELLAVAGVPLGHELLAHATERPAGDVASELDAAVEAQLLERPPTRTEFVQFRHGVTRDTLLSEIAPLRRRELHAQLARALEPTASPATAPMLARHFMEAGDGQKALRYAREGARGAIRVGAYGTAIDLLTRASQLAAGTTDEAAVLEELGNSLKAAESPVEAETVLRRARALHPVEAVTQVARIDIQLAAVLRMQGRRVEAVEAAERAVALLELGGDSSLGEAIVVLADLALAEGDPNRAAELSEHALRIGREGERGTLVVSALSVLGMARARRADPGAIGTLREAIRIGTDVGLHRETDIAWLELSRAQLLRGEFAEAGASAETALRLARQHGLEMLQSRALRHLTTILVNHGNFGEARAYAEQAIALARPDTLVSDGAKVSLAHILTNQGEHDAALALFDQIAPRIVRHELEQRVLYHAYRANAFVVAGRLDEAASAAEAAIAETVSRPGLGMTAFLAATGVWEARRDGRRLKELAELADRYFSGRETAPIRAMRAEVAAILASLDGGDAALAFTDLAAMYDRLAARVHATYRRASAAMARLSDPAQRRVARRELEALRQQLLEQGAFRYVRLMDVAMARPVAHRARPSALLAGRHLRVALMLSQGYTDRRIAHELGVPLKSATLLVSGVLDRLGVRTRSQVAGWVVAREPQAAALVPAR